VSQLIPAVLTSKSRPSTPILILLAVIAVIAFATGSEAAA
jgi:hypothetical protein